MHGSVYAVFIYVETINRVTGGITVQCLTHSVKINLLHRITLLIIVISRILLNYGTIKM